MRRVRGFRTFTAMGLMALALSAVAADGAPPRTLVDLVREGKRDSVLAAITSPHVDVNAKAADGSTPLMWATFNVDYEMVDALLKAGAKANVANRYGATALTEAIKLQDMRLFRTLLDAGANVNSPNLDNQTALMLAISVGAQDMAKVLIERGADVHAVETFRGQTALMWAAGGNQPEIVDLLLAKGAGKDVNLRARHDDWARMMTSEPRAQFGSRQTGGLTALLYATRAGCLACAVSLVNAGADVNRPNPDGVTPLINALDNRRFDIAMFLLEKNANPHVWDMSGRTALYVAVTMRAPPAGPGGGGGGGPGGRASAGVTGGAQTAAAMDVIKRLLDQGVDPNHELTRKRPYGSGGGRFAEYDRRGGTGPLMIAAMNSDQEAIEVLLAHGAEVDLRNVFRMTPLMVASGMAGTGRADGGAAQAGERTFKAIDALLAGGADINAQVNDSHTRTAVLVSYVQGRDQEGRTALMAAAERGADRMVKHLLERGANATLRDATGKTAIDLAKVPAADNLAPEAKERLIAGRTASVKLLEAAISKTGVAAN